MEKGKEEFKEASPDAQLEQIKLAYGRPSKVEVLGKKIKIRPITSAAMDIMSSYLVKQVEINVAETAELIAKQKPNLKLQCKAISVALLSDSRLNGFAGWFKVSFMHWFHWRKIFWSYSSGEIGIVLSKIVEQMNLVFFYQNMGLTKGLNSLQKKRTKAEAESLQAELESEKKQDS